MNLFFDRILFTFLVVAMVFTSCEKEEGFFFDSLNSDEIQLHYNETQCADPWTQFFIDKQNDGQENVEIKSNKEELLKVFFEDKQISVLEVEYIMADDSDIVTCTECECYTGAVFYVKTLRDDIVIKNLVDLGFIVSE